MFESLVNRYAAFLEKWKVAPKPAWDANEARVAERLEKARRRRGEGATVADGMPENREEEFSADLIKVLAEFDLVTDHIVERARHGELTAAQIVKLRALLDRDFRRPCD